jgi:hypothetical protein
MGERPAHQSPCSPNSVIEPLEPRLLFSATAATFDVSLPVGKASVVLSQSFPVAVTVSNRGNTTINSVTPTLNQAAGQVIQAKYYSPAVASIAPGKSVVFKYTLEELVTGAQTLTANANSPFATSAGSASTNLLVSAKTVAGTALTDASGDAYLKVGKSVVPVQIQDQNTGIGISGLSVAIEPANKQDSRALLVVTDSQGRYPLQMVVLQGARAASSNAPAMLESTAAAPSPTAINISSGSTTALSAAIGAIQTSFLPAYSGQTSATGVTGAFQAALKALSTSRLPLPVPFAGAAAPKVLYQSGPVAVPDSLTRLGDITSEFVKTATVGEIIVGGLELITAGEISLPLAAVMLTADFSFATVNNLLFEETDAQDVNISVESDGGFFRSSW